MTAHTEPSTAQTGDAHRAVDTAAPATATAHSGSAEASLTAMARSHRRPTVEVADLYEKEVVRLTASARITTYLGVLALRNTQLRLLQADRQPAP